MCQLKELLHARYIWPSKSLFCAPILFQKKYVGSLRMCIDYWALKGLMVKGKIPIWCEVVLKVEFEVGILASADRGRRWAKGCMFVALRIIWVPCDAIQVDKRVVGTKLGPAIDSQWTCKATATSPTWFQCKSDVELDLQLILYIISYNWIKKGASNIEDELKNEVDHIFKELEMKQRKAKKLKRSFNSVMMMIC